MTSTSKIVLGILGAATAGVVIGLLIAPEKGSETRKRISKRTGELADTLSNLFVRGKEVAEESIGKIRHAKSTAEEKVNKIKESFS